MTARESKKVLVVVALIAVALGATVGITIMQVARAADVVTTVYLSDGETIQVVCAVDTPEPTATTTPTPTLTSTSEPTDTPTATATPSEKLVGIFDYPPETGWPAVSVTRLNHVVLYLEQARQANMSALVALTGGHSGYTTDGDFDLSKWRAVLDSRDLSAIQGFVDDGTIVGLYAIDEPHDWGGGAGPTYAELDAACEYAHQRLPGIACGYNTPPAWLLPGAPYADIDFIFTQTNFRRAQTPVQWTAWAEQQFADAAACGIEPVYLSINAYTDNPSAAQVQSAGEALCRFPVKGVMAWKWRHVQGMESAFDAIAEACTGN